MLLNYHYFKKILLYYRYNYFWGNVIEYLSKYPKIQRESFVVYDQFGLYALIVNTSRILYLIHVTITHFKR